MNRRALTVTAIVAALGGVAGAIGGGLIMAAIDIVASGGVRPSLESLPFYGVATAIGFVHGLVLGPVLAWAALRTAPLWRAIGETAVAASIGAAVAIFSGAGIPLASLGALVAASAAAGRLRLEMNRRAAAELPPSDAPRELLR